MSKTVQSKATWFLLCDKWHRESFIHCMEDGAIRSICGTQDITPANSDSVVKFETIEEIPLKDICKKCLKRMI